MKTTATLLISAALLQSAAAMNITVLETENSYGGPFVSPLFSFGLGTGVPNAEQTSAPVTGNGVTYTFSNGGIFAGSVVNLSQSPLGSGNSTVNYAVAFGNGGKVTATWATPQTSLLMDWGTVDTDLGRNVVTGSGITITGQEVVNALIGQGFPFFGNGKNDTWIDVTSLPAFTSLTFSDTSANSFEFGIGPDPVPGPVVGAGLPGLLLGATGLGFLGWKRRRFPAS